MLCIVLSWGRGKFVQNQFFFNLKVNNFKLENLVKKNWITSIEYEIETPIAKNNIFLNGLMQRMVGLILKL